MATAPPDTYKMMGALAGITVVICAVMVDFWPWPQLIVILLCLAACAVEFTRRVVARYEADRERYFGFIHRADLQHRAGIEGDLERWFYGDFVPADEHNIFSDHWEKTLQPEPEPEPEPLTPEEACEGLEGCECRDCRRERPYLARSSWPSAQRDRPGRLRRPGAMPVVRDPLLG
jgi:hypothetical protein